MVTTSRALTVKALTAVAAFAIALTVTGAASAQEQTVESAHEFLRLTMTRRDVRLNDAWWPSRHNAAEITRTRASTARVANYETITPCAALITTASGASLYLKFDELDINRIVWDRATVPMSESSFLWVKVGVSDLRKVLFASDELVQRMYAAMQFLDNSCDPAEQTGF